MKGVGGIIFSVTLAGGAVLALTRALHNVDYDQVFAIIRQTEIGVIGVALSLVAASYGTITLYDWLALKTHGAQGCSLPHCRTCESHQLSDRTRHRSGRADIAHHSLSDLFQQRYRRHGRGQHLLFDRATFWLGNMTALGFSLLCEPVAIGMVDHLAPGLPWRGRRCTAADGNVRPVN